MTDSQDCKTETRGRAAGLDTGRTEILEQRMLVLHPDDAQRLSVGDGDLVRLTSAHGADTLVAQVSASVPPGITFASINALNGSAIFPAGLPDLKACAVRLEKADGDL